MARAGRRELALHIIIRAAGVLLVLAAVACGSGSSQPAASTATAEPQPSAATAGPAVTYASLRDVDFEAPEIVAELISRAGGGEVDARRVVFEDLTDDGDEEAVVVVESGGTLGDIGVAVYRLIENRPELAFFLALTGRVEVRFGFVVIEEGVYAPGDAQCCPSQLRELTYGWDGEQFALAADQVVDSPGR